MFAFSVGLLKGRHVQVGGVDQLLELVETGVGITEHKTRSYPLAVYYGEDDLPEVTTCNVPLVTHTCIYAALSSWHTDAYRSGHRASAAAFDQVIQWDCTKCVQSLHYAFCFSSNMQALCFSANTIFS